MQASELCGEGKTCAGSLLYAELGQERAEGTIECVEIADEMVCISLKSATWTRFGEAKKEGLEMKVKIPLESYVSTHNGKISVICQDGVRLHFSGNVLPFRQPKTPQCAISA